MVAENGHAVFDQAGRLLRIFGTTLDITARHHLEQLRNRREKGLETLDRRMRRLSTLLHQPQRFYVAVCDGIKELVSADLSALPLIDNSGSTYTYVAAAGTKSGHLVGQTLPLDSGLCGWTVSHGERILVANLKQDERVNQSLLEQLDVSSGLLTPITREGRIIGGLAAYRKGTPFDEIDDEMIGLLGQRVSAYLDNMELMTTLEHRVRERTLELEAINRELASFSYSVSHDLRAPLRAIDGFSQALLEDYGNTLDATGHDYLFRVRRACQRMGSLIDDMLGLSRLTRREMRWERVDLSQLAKTSVEQLRIHAPRESVTLRIRDGVEANADAKLMQIVFDNLMGNAWKYTSREAISVIEFDYLDSPDGRTYFVRDNGVGFDMQYADKLFGAFQRLHKESEFEGSALGLPRLRALFTATADGSGLRGRSTKARLFTLP